MKFLLPLQCTAGEKGCKSGTLIPSYDKESLVELFIDRRVILQSWELSSHTPSTWQWIPLVNDAVLVNPCPVLFNSHLFIQRWHLAGADHSLFCFLVRTRRAMQWLVYYLLLLLGCVNISLLTVQLMMYQLSVCVNSYVSPFCTNKS